MQRRKRNRICCKVSIGNILSNFWLFPRPTRVEVRLRIQMSSVRRPSQMLKYMTSQPFIQLWPNLGHRFIGELSCCGAIRGHMLRSTVIWGQMLKFTRKTLLCLVFRKNSRIGILFKELIEIHSMWFLTSIKICLLSNTSLERANVFQPSRKLWKAS